MTEQIEVPVIIGGRVVFGHDVEHDSHGVRFVTPELDLDALAGPRAVDGPAFDSSLDDILSFLVVTGERLRADKAGYLAQALDNVAAASPLSRRIIKSRYDGFLRAFDRSTLEFQVETEIGTAVLDGWVSVARPGDSGFRVRAFPPRVVHVLAGNAPGVAARTVISAAISKGVHLFKLPGNDVFTTTAILRTMIDIDPEHPTVRSLSAAYWRGGDVGVEDLIYRAQYFDKLVVWGGEDAVRNALRYASPGFEVISFDPKVSVSLVGREAFSSSDALHEAAMLGADDITLLNQDACSASRFQFVEGTVDQVDSYCELLALELAVDRPAGDGQGPAAPAGIREEVEGLRFLEPDYRVWGDYDGHGLVVRSEEPVDFDLEAKTVNVVRVDSLADAVRWTSVATQTVGVYPSGRKVELRDPLAAAGVQRVVALGCAGGGGPGEPHDGSYPLHRMMRWVVDDERVPETAEARSTPVHAA